MSPTIRLATLDDLSAYHEHLRRHAHQLTRIDHVITAPYDDPWDRPFDILKKLKEEKWSLPVREIGWERCWIIEDGGSIYGDLKLAHAIGLKASLHRAFLMMGIERSYRGKGLGSALMREALSWANRQPTLEWVQLNVFAHNEPAKALYRRFGFKEIGTNQDFFRVKGQQIDDTESKPRICTRAGS
jgi:RimJ/RimL family protein N-acetyltransferase